ncbi:hypothetical protein ATCC90586_004508 [Pythium insidiosum]|nr:hypothetical protein ATCC90586_004508 [Pythium insidiosum]
MANTNCIKLCSLVVGFPSLLHVSIGGEQATVSILHKRILDQLGGSHSRSLVLYLACVQPTDPDNSGAPSPAQWLMENDVATPYLCGTTAPSEDSTAAELLSRFVVMHPLEWLSHYVPTQPPLLSDGSLVVHIVAVPDPPVAPLALPSERPVERWLRSLGRAVEQPVLLPSPKTQALRRFTVLHPSASGDSLWLAPDSPLALLARPSWTHLLPRAREWLAPRAEDSRRAVCIDGAAGVGKSAFVAYLLSTLLGPTVDDSVDADTRPRHIVLDVPGVTFACIDVTQKKVVEGERGRDFVCVLRRQSTWYVCDLQTATDLPLRDTARREIVVRSSARPLPRVQPVHRWRLTLVMPLWSLEELRVAHGLHVAPNSRTIATMEQLFLKWGGLPRRVLARDARASELELVRQLAQLDRQRVKEMLHFVHKHEWVTKRWMKDMPDLVVRTCGGGSARHDSAVHVQFCSQYVCDSVIQWVDCAVAQLLKCEDKGLPLLWRQIRMSAMYLRQEEEEKSEGHAGTLARMKMRV